MKIKHYAQPLKTLAKSSIENVILEIAVAIVSGTLSLASYKTGFGILFFPMFAVFCLCMLGISLSITLAIKEYIVEKRKHNKSIMARTQNAWFALLRR
ncbi:hypothetical protein HII17_00010 [Thalassotalea sp. M1531]|uniref:Uncharacterized protein n=1 Tax=Thalassotalea algicola TaxID=2716224 RepID=A0A7Y0Q5P2_9GAMM|nr:hypothetical protein [Thalassotalea algicola]NMP29927.1 hypothetical protein [Thalassotalea algicola]